MLPDEPHGPLLLTVEPYQDQASGCPVTELDGKVTWVGTLQLDTPEVRFLFAGLGVSLGKTWQPEMPFREKTYILTRLS